MKIKGGIGNQLFQYAAALALQHKYGGKIFLLADWFLGPQRSPELSQYRRSFELNKIRFKTNVKVIANNRIASLLETSCKKYSQKYGDELIVLDKMDESNVLDHRRIYLDGFFLFSLNHEDIRDLILYNFVLRDKFEKNVRKFMDGISKKTLGVHIRRGDNVFQNVNVLPKDFYLRAIDFFRELNLQVILFSDDVEWCMAQVEFKDMLICKSLNDIEQLFAMSRCDYLVTSGSTYSWWGAFLMDDFHSNNVISPHPFFDSPNYDIYRSRFIPKSWVLLSRV